MMHFENWIMFDPGCAGHYLATTQAKNLYNDTVPWQNFKRMNGESESSNYRSCFTAFYPDEAAEVPWWEPKIFVSHKFQYYRFLEQLYSFDTINIIEADKISNLLIAFKIGFAHNVNSTHMQQMIKQVAMTGKTFDTDNFSYQNIDGIIDNQWKKLGLKLKNIQHHVRTGNDLKWIPLVQYWFAQEMFTTRDFSEDSFLVWINDWLTKQLADDNTYREFQPGQLKRLDRMSRDPIIHCKFSDIMKLRTQIKGVYAEDIETYYAKNTENLRGLLYPLLNDANKQIIKQLL